ncbi:MAG: 30S ribosomal protein S15 [Spirochaetes bacterium GWD1_27_9]|nr:MAG: 30S ribosomal protein S15 [Spirochaetes bacterium GWB1_27_13]OHD20233.1 MAG: 30S ribosomal protein S15 [Spirochaetes bacterium GWC1_27_15]OHD42580.1 MAG: 30S ribosomal protein S15 [Spirochaetes bacterium GWD1_27_9]
MITVDRKKELVKDFGKSEKNTGSTEVQIALLTERIKYLTGHFKDHPKDFHSRRGLLMLVGRRRRFLDHLKKKNLDSYRDLIERLGIRK